MSRGGVGVLVLVFFFLFGLDWIGLDFGCECVNVTFIIKKKMRIDRTGGSMKLTF